jgi:hypothetical protein
MKRSTVTPRQAAERLKEIMEQKRAAKAARSAARRVKAAANTKTHKAPPETEDTPPKRKVRSVAFKILLSCEIPDLESGEEQSIEDVGEKSALC